MKKLFSILLLVSIGLLPSLAFAQPTGTGLNGSPVQLPSSAQSGIQNISNVQNVVCQIFNWMFYILIIAAIFMILLAAFKYITAAGDSEKIQVASKMLIYAAVAVAVAIFAQAIPIIVFNFFVGTGAGTTGVSAFSVCP